MGNAESGPIVRNADKRTSRREHRAIFEAAAQRFRLAPFEAPERFTAAQSRGVRVCVRKRPIFSHELEQGEFDAVTCLEPGRIVVHDARMHPDMVKLFMNHHDFGFDEAFGEQMGNFEVYQGTARQIVQNALEGKSGTVMMYGQTGSGKTYTMRSIYEQAADEIFQSPRSVTVSFIELFGESCFDMLNQGVPCQLTTAQDGSVHPFPCVEVEVQTPSELLALIDLAGRLRATAATGVHDQSSRSHALCRVFVDSDGEEGSLTLVDLAGSEHRIDNAEHNAERRKEGAKINASLAALKECIRARASGAKFIAFRQNRLTQLLRGCFLPGGHHETVVVATVSPSSKDTEHSLNTLRHACIMDGQGQGKQEKGSHLGGGAVTKETLGEIDVTKIARERRQKQKEAPEPTAEWGKPPSKPAHQSKESNTSRRAALDRKYVRLLEPSVAQRLQDAREAWGTAKQRMRLARPPAVEESQEPEAKPEPRAPAPEPAAPVPAPANAARAEAREAPVEPQDPDKDRAIELFRTFLSQGREGQNWRKNDLRLINLFVVPWLFGEARIDWNHPVLALDELEQLVKESPERLKLLGNAKPSAQSPKPAPPAPPAPAPASARPPLPGRLRSPETPNGAGTSWSTPSNDQPPLRRAGTGDVRRKPAEESPTSRNARSASPASRPPASHSEVIRARREAMEQARQEALQKALAKKAVPQSREEEIASLEAQILGGGGSSYAAAGLKRRLQSLKATMLREEKLAAAKAAAGQRVASPVPVAPRPRSGSLSRPSSAGAG
ncbi:unnamed protein product [Effrenium voratum]|uniref:Kinesin-like protein n=1 Tax=Effrenium voratum TaxID=2562239 RepID=A0AA36MJQ8_9DINO|nr:unnamed protein product [Effrenium voratum]